MEILNKICTNFKTSKRLKELGIEEETFFYWWFYDFDKKVHLTSEHQYINSGHIKNKIKAYTLEQILEMLPKRIRLKSDKFPSRFFKYSLKVDMKELKIYYNCSSEIKYCIDIDYNIATTGANLLIKLKENKDDDFEETKPKAKKRIIEHDKQINLFTAKQEIKFYD